MPVKDLIELLLRCDLDAYVVFSDEEGNTSLIEFVEWNARDNSILLYEDKPNFEEPRDEDIEIIVEEEEDCFAVTSCREL